MDSDDYISQKVAKALYFLNEKEKEENLDEKIATILSEIFDKKIVDTFKKEFKNLKKEDIVETKAIKTALKNTLRIAEQEVLDDLKKEARYKNEDPDSICSLNEITLWKEHNLDKKLPPDFKKAENKIMSMIDKISSLEEEINISILDLVKLKDFIRDLKI